MRHVITVGGFFFPLMTSRGLDSDDEHRGLLVSFTKNYTNLKVLSSRIHPRASFNNGYLPRVESTNEMHVRLHVCKKSFVKDFFFFCNRNESSEESRYLSKF